MYFFGLCFILAYQPFTPFLLTLFPLTLNCPGEQEATWKHTNFRLLLQKLLSFYMSFQFTLEGFLFMNQAAFRMSQFSKFKTNNSTDVKGLELVPAFTRWSKIIDQAQYTSAAIASPDSRYFTTPEISALESSPRFFAESL